MGRRAVPFVLGLVFVLGCGDGEVSPSGAGGSSPSTGPTWCQVRQVLEAKCQRCHADPPLNEAPFALVTFEHTQVPEAAGGVRWRRMQKAIETGFMPSAFPKLEPPVEGLTAAERELLFAWFDAGANATGGLTCSP